MRLEYNDQNGKFFMPVFDSPKPGVLTDWKDVVRNADKLVIEQFIKEIEPRNPTKPFIDHNAMCSLWHNFKLTA